LLTSSQIYYTYQNVTLHVLHSKNNEINVSIEDNITEKTGVDWIKLALANMIIKLQVS
jgi:hypothetical protein